jgi:hypothetical protein
MSVYASHQGIHTKSPKSAVANGSGHFKGEGEEQSDGDDEKRNPGCVGIRILAAAIRAEAGKLKATVLINGIRHLPARSTRSILKPVHAWLVVFRGLGLGVSSETSPMQITSVSRRTLLAHRIRTHRYGGGCEAVRHPRSRQAA